MLQQKYYILNLLHVTFHSIQTLHSEVKKPVMSLRSVEPLISQITLFQIIYWVTNGKSEHQCQQPASGALVLYSTIIIISNQYVGFLFAKFLKMLKNQTFASFYNTLIVTLICLKYNLKSWHFCTIIKSFIFFYQLSHNP